MRSLRTARGQVCRCVAQVLLSSFSPDVTLGTSRSQSSYTAETHAACTSLLLVQSNLCQLILANRLIPGVLTGKCPLKRAMRKPGSSVSCLLRQVPKQASTLRSVLCWLLWMNCCKLQAPKGLAEFHFGMSRLPFPWSKSACPFLT